MEKTPSMNFEQLIPKEFLILPNSKSILKSFMKNYTIITLLFFSALIFGCKKENVQQNSFRASFQAVINNGQTVFMFDNGMNPGGIVAIDESAVFAQIEDPAYGTVKTVNIQYTTDDQPNVIHVMEYDTITM